MTPPSRRGVTTPPKSTLFCPVCGHQSRYDGDWTGRTVGSATQLLCPDCGTEITSRPDFDGRRSAERLARYWELWRRCLDAWRAVWWEPLPAATTAG